jgi:hypothetical protein
VVFASVAEQLWQTAIDSSTQHWKNRSSDMATSQVQKEIIKALQAPNTELSLNDLVAKVRPNAPSGREDVKKAVVPLLYLRQVTLTPERKFRIA